MPVVNVRVMAVTVCQSAMRMEMRMRFLQLHPGGMFVLVMLIMDVAMGMRDSFMNMRMLVPLRQMEPYANGHDTAGDEQRKSEHFSEENY